MRLSTDWRITDSRLSRGFAAIAALVALLTLGTRGVSAQDTPYFVCRLAERTTWGAILDCEPGYATDRDRIVIYAEVPSDWGPPGETVASLPDLAEGAVVFDAGADATPNLIVVFSRREQGALVANIYDDRNGDGRVSATVTSEGEVEVTEAGPVVQVVSSDGWWEREGIVSYNLDISVDGLVRASFSSSLEKYLTTDGTPEVQAHVRDPDADGRPDYEWRQIHLPLGEFSGYVRTEVAVNTEDDEPPANGAILWPYLGDSRSDWSQYTKGSYTSSTPPIDVDWRTSQVTHVAEFVGSRTQPGNYFIYSISRLLEGQISVADFEAPFAYYDLSDGVDPFPTLMIRDSNFGARDPFFWGGALALPSHDISYVWRYPASKTENAPIWDYKINLIGTNDQASVVEVGDLAFVASDYTAFPYWVTGKSWDTAAFVADEGGQVPNAEGIAAWGATLEHLSPHSYEYVTGLIDELPLNGYKTIPQGYRGEVAPHFGQPARVYIGSLDGKLHLLHAKTGIWNVGGEAELRHASLDGDAYLDQWRYFEDGELRRQLNWTPDYLVYAGDDRVLLKQANVAPALFQTTPPRNHEEWLELEQQLQMHRRNLAPGDLEAMIADFDGPVTRIEGARLRAFRPDGAGFRFLLTLTPGYRHNGMSGPDLAGRAPGDYVVTYEGDGFLVEPLVPSNPEVADGSVRLSNPQPLERATEQLQASIYNAGLEDIDQLLVSASATGPDSEVEKLGTITVTLLAEQLVPVHFDWTPSRPGEWQLALALGEVKQQPPSGSSLDEVSLAVHVAASPEPPIGWILRTSHVSQPLALGVFLGAFACVAASLALLALTKAKGPS